MDLFFTLLEKLLPLYVFMGAGYIAARWLKTSSRPLADILIYVLMPLVYFVAIGRLQLQSGDFVLPLVFFSLACINCFAFYYGSRAILKDETRNVLGYSVGTVNSGYFGVGLFLALMPPENLGSYLLAVFGYMFYDSGVGYYLLARGRYTMQESLARLLRLPVIYACLAGLAIAIMKIQMPDVFIQIGDLGRSAMVVIGMMTVGMALAGLKPEHWDWKFLSLAFIAKFFVMPALAAAIIVLDRMYFGALTDVGQMALLIWAIVPPAANTAVFATQLDVQPEKAASVVFSFTIIALVYIPLAWILLTPLHS